MCRYKNGFRQAEGSSRGARTRADQPERPSQADIDEMKRRRKISQRKKLKGKTSNGQGVRVTGQMALAAAASDISDKRLNAAAEMPDLVP